MAAMTPTPQAMIHARLNAMGMTPLQLATQLGITPALLEQALGDPLLQSEGQWLAVLDALGLEAVIQPKSEP